MAKREENLRLKGSEGYAIYCVARPYPNHNHSEIQNHSISILLTSLASSSVELVEKAVEAENHSIPSPCILSVCSSDHPPSSLIIPDHLFHHLPPPRRS